MFISLHIFVYVYTVRDLEDAGMALLGGEVRGARAILRRGVGRHAPRQQRCRKKAGHDKPVAFVTPLARESFACPPNQVNRP